MNYDFDGAKEEYRKLCKEEPTIWIYIQDWYLDATCYSESDWRVIIIKDDKAQIVAAFPFGYKRKFNLWMITNPWQCKRMGIWWRKREFSSKNEELIFREEIINQIIERLPRFDRFEVMFNYDFYNWQPFYWKGFSATPYYSMRITPKMRDTWNVSKSRRQAIKRASKIYSVSEGEFPFIEYWMFLEKSYKSLGRKCDFKKGQLEKLYSSLQTHHAYTTMFALDGNNNPSAAIIKLHYGNTWIEQFSTQMVDDKNGKSLIEDFSIRKALDSGEIWDFEGSMNQGICEFNSSFNPEWTSYYCITKNNIKYEVISFFRKVFKRNGLK